MTPVEGILRSGCFVLGAVFLMAAFVAVVG
jgi:hypothetical protein